MNAPIHTKTFKSGNSEAVRLPKGMGFGIGTEVIAERQGERIILTPQKSVAARRRELEKLIADMQAIGAPADGIQPRDPFEFPDRPGL
jgi:antitoxin VapB